MRIAANQAVSSPVPASLAVPARQTAARVAFAGGLLSLVSLLALHGLKPDLAPSWHVVSEYALGPYGWVMALCFASLAVGCASLLVTLAPQMKTTGARIGLALLGIAAIGLAMASMFPMDPITTPPAPPSTSGKMHGVAAMLGIPELVIAAVVLSYSLRRHPRWASVRGPLLGVAHLTWISMVLMFTLLGVAIANATPGPEMMIGWPNRLLMVGYCAWVMLAAWPEARGARLE
jgi:hypothetical protein